MSSAGPPRGGRATATACGAGALLLSTAALGPLFSDARWVPSALAVVVLVALTGVGLRSVRCPPPLVVLAQAGVIAVLVTVVFTHAGVLGVLPGPGAVGEVRDLLAGAGRQVRQESVPVPVRPELQVLLVLLLGAAAVTVDLFVAPLRAPAGAGLVLLAMIAVPASLLDELLPWWSFVLAAAALVLLLLADAAQRVRRSGSGAGPAGLRSPAVLAVVAMAVAAGLLGGSSAVGVGTEGRLASRGGGEGGVGLNPFTQLRGQLDQPQDVPLFTVQGLPDPTYLRAVALDTYIANQGWVVDRTSADQAAQGSLDPGPLRGQDVSVTVTAQQYTDRWLPSPGVPTAVTGTAGPLQGYSYDDTLDTLHAPRSRPLPGYRVDAVVPGGSAAELRAAGSPGAGSAGSPGPRFYATTGIDPQVRQIAETVAGGTDALDAAVRLTDYLRDPANGFRYSVQTVDPGTGRDALVSFLTAGRTGFCEQFASAMAAMMRTLGFASRVGVGFTAGTGDAAQRQVTTSDAHAWVEVYFTGVGWVQFDPTPLSDGRGVVPGYVTQAQPSPAGAASAPTSRTAAPRVAPSTAPSPAVPSAAPTPAPGAADLGASPGPTSSAGVWRLVATGAVVVLVALLGAPAAARWRRRRARWGEGTASASWAEVLDAAADRGVRLRASETPRQTVERLTTELGVDEPGRVALHSLVDAVERSWYGPGSTAGLRQRQRQRDSGLDLGRSAVRTLQRATPLGVRGRLLPRSLRRDAGAGSL